MMSEKVSEPRMSDVESIARFEELKRLAEPVVDFIYRYGSPHSYVVITETSAELISGECGISFEPRD